MDKYIGSIFYLIKSFIDHTIYFSTMKLILISWILIWHTGNGSSFQLVSLWKLTFQWPRRRSSGHILETVLSVFIVFLIYIFYFDHLFTVSPKIKPSILCNSHIPKSNITLIPLSHNIPRSLPQKPALSISQSWNHFLCHLAYVIGGGIGGWKGKGGKGKIADIRGGRSDLHIFLCLWCHETQDLN